LSDKELKELRDEARYRHTKAIAFVVGILAAIGAACAAVIKLLSGASS
jgi:hypothetical protein